MPDAATYRDAARRCRLLGEHVAHEALAHRSSPLPDRIAAGPVRDIVDGQLHAVHAHLVRATAELARLAVECDRRAAVCEAYRREAHRWSALPWTERLLRPAPRPPAPWASA